MGTPILSFVTIHYLAKVTSLSPVIFFYTLFRMQVSQIGSYLKKSQLKVREKSPGNFNYSSFYDRVDVTAEWIIYLVHTVGLTVL